MSKKKSKKLAAIVMSLSMASCIAALPACFATETYTVTFKDGETTIEVTVNKGEAATAPDSWELPGYTLSWDGEFSDIQGNITINAVWTANKYAVTLNLNGGSISGELNQYTYGEGATLPVPTKAGHTFGGWYDNAEYDGDAITAITATDIEAKTYYAKWSINSYTVTFKNADGTTIQSGSLEYGATPSCEITPTKAEDAQCTYTFTGWDKEISAVTGDVEYTATYSSTAKKYTVTFKNDDGSTIQSGEVEYGTVPTCATTPTKAETAQYTYTFNGWDKEVSAVTGAVEYTATYAQTVRKYTVTFKNADGSTIQSSEVEYGTVPTCATTPTKAEDAQYTYTFNGWNAEVVAVSGAVEYTATYSSTVRKYTVTFKNADGTTIQSGEVEYGTVPACETTPSKAADEHYTYTFSGWNTEVVAVTGAVEYTATYTSVGKSYSVSLNNIDDATCDSLTSYTYGAGATLPMPVREGYPFGGWVDESGNVVSAISATDDGDKSYTAKWLAVDNSISEKQCILTAEQVDAMVTVDNVLKKGVYNIGVEGWYHDSDFNTANDMLYAHFAVYYMQGGTSKITIPAINVAPYAKVEFGLTFGNGVSGVTSVKVNGTEITLQNHSVLVIEGGQIKVYAVNAYTAIKDTIAYSGGDIVLEVESSAKNIHVSEVHAVKNTYDYVAKANEAAEALNAWYAENSITATALKADSALLAIFDGYMNAIDSAVACMTDLESTAFEGKVSADALATKEAMNVCTVTVKNMDGADASVSVARGSSVAEVSAEREGYVLVGFTDESGNAIANSAVITSDTVLVAKWYKGGAAEKVVLTSVEEYGDKLGVSATGISKVAPQDNGIAWYVDSNGDKYSRIYKLWMASGPASIIIPAFNTNVYSKIEFGLSTNGSTNGINGIKVNGIPCNVMGHYIISVENGDIYYGAPANYNGNKVKIGAYDGGNITVEYDYAGSGITVWLFETRATQVAYDYMAKANEALNTLNNGSYTVAELKNDAEKLAEFDACFAVIDDAIACMTAREKATFSVPQDLLDIKAALSKCMVTFSNIGEDKQLLVDKGAKVEAPEVSKEGYVFGGWYTADGTLFDIDSNIASDTVLSAKWLVIGDAQRVTLMTAEDIYNQIKLPTGARSEIQTVAAANKAWYQDSTTAKYENANKFYTTQSTVITIPAVNMNLYSMIEFGLSASTANIAKITVCGNEIQNIHEHYIISIENGVIYECAPGSYASKVMVGQYNGGDIVVEYTLQTAGSGKNIYMFEVRGTQIAYDMLDEVVAKEAAISSYIATNGTELTDAQKTELFGLVNAYYVAYNSLSAPEQTAHPVSEAITDAKAALAGDYFLGISGRSYVAGSDTYVSSAAPSEKEVKNGPIGAPYAVDKIVCYDVTNGNLGGKVMTLTLPKINFKALDCSVSINLGRQANSNTGSVYINGNKIGNLMQRSYQGILSIAKDAEGNYVLTHYYISGSVTTATYTLTEAQATGEEALVITMDVETETQWWGVFVSDMYVKFN